jgi:hypothetical protein
LLRGENVNRIDELRRAGCTITKISEETGFDGDTSPPDLKRNCLRHEQQHTPKKLLVNRVIGPVWREA